MVILQGSQLPGLPEPLVPLWHAHHRQARDILGRIATALDIAPDRLLGAVPSSPRPAAGGGSVMRLIYHAGGGRGSATGWHEDAGVLTLIARNPEPAFRCTAGPWEEVVDLEEAAPADHVLVLAGRALSRLVNGQIPTCLHSVANTRRPRLSLAYHLRVAEDASIDMSALAPAPGDEAYFGSGSICGAEFCRQFCTFGASVHSTGEEFRTGEW